MKKKFIIALLVVPFLASAQSKISSFKIGEVRIDSGIFKAAENTDLNYMMALEPDRLLAPFLREANLPAKTKSYTNWENTGLDGHIGGHYLSALSLMYASTGNKAVLSRLDYMLAELKRCQDANGNGYIGGVPGSKQLWLDIAEGKINAGVFDLNKKWVPLYNIHKTYAGLRDAYLHADSKLAKEMLLKYTDWMLAVTSNLDADQIQKMLTSEHGGLNEVFADVAAITGNKKYLELARKFSHQVILKPLEKQEDRLNNLHANTQIPKVIGFERIAAVSGTDDAYHTAAKFFWKNVVTKRTSAIGGNSVREHFHPLNDFSSMISSEQGPETCNTYNMLRLSKALFEADGEEQYIHYYERAIYNHILSTQHPEKGGFVYFTPMRPGHYRVYSQPQTSFWCCVGSGLENHAKYSELIYAHKGTELYVNLFIPSTLTWKEKGLVLTQKTFFPDKETTEFQIESLKKPNFSLNIRYPNWVAAKTLTIKVNGQTVKINDSPGSYVRIDRKWKKGDKITVSLPMTTSVEQLPDGSDYVAVLHGPVVLAAKTSTQDMPGLFAGDDRMAHIANGKKIPLQELPLFVSKNADLASQIIPVSGKPLTFTASNLIYPDRYRSLELIPFFRLHDSRYVIYWQSLSPEKFDEIRSKMAEQENIKQKLEALTVDLVSPGEQQPESDHFLESYNSETGVTEDRHWRSAKDGWFSYRMSNKEKKGDRIMITYHGKDSGRKCKILVNDQLLKDVVLDNTSDSFYTVEYSLSPEMRREAAGDMNIKILSSGNSATPRVFEVRLLKPLSN